MTSGLPVPQGKEATAADWIAHHARHAPSKLACTDLHSGRERTYAEFHDRIARLAAFLDYSESRMWRKSQLMRWTDSVKVGGVFQKGGKERLKNMPDLLTEKEAFQILDQPATVAVSMGDVEWFQSQLYAQHQKSMAFPLGIYRKRGIESLRAAPLVTIGTIHSVKGGEADSVYLFPDLSPQGMMEWTGGPSQQASVYRLFYVGMTRARETLRVCAPSSPMSVDL